MPVPAMVYDFFFFFFQREVSVWFWFGSFFRDVTLPLWHMKIFFFLSMMSMQVRRIPMQ